MPWLGATLWTKYLIDLFLKPHPWISQLSPNYNSAGSTASKAYLIRLCQLRFQCFFFLRYQIILEELLQMIFFSQSTSPITEIICVKNVRAKVFCGIICFDLRKKIMLKIWKILWEPFGSCLLNSKANPANFYPNGAGLAVLFSRHLPNGSHDLFYIFSTIFL